MQKAKYSTTYAKANCIMDASIEALLLIDVSTAIHQKQG